MAWEIKPLRVEPLLWQAQKARLQGLQTQLGACKYKELFLGMCLGCADAVTKPSVAMVI